MQGAAFTILNLFERIYDRAVVPDDMEAIINPCDLEDVIQWQKRHPVTTDDSRVLTIERLGEHNHAALMAFQMFAFNTAAKSPDFGQ